MRDALNLLPLRASKRRIDLPRWRYFAGQALLAGAIVLVGGTLAGVFGAELILFVWAVFF